MLKYFRSVVLLLVISMLLNLLCFAGVQAAGEQWPADYGLKGLEMPFRPPDKYVTQQNPPDFRWPLIESAKYYEVRICRDSEMKDVAYEKNNIVTNFYNFDKTFDIGTYYWSVRFYAGNNASEWSDVRRFRIDPDAYEFPVESVDKLLEKVPQNHPRIWTTSENLEKFKEVGKYGDGKDIYDHAVKVVREYMNKPMQEEPKVDDSADYYEIWAIVKDTATPNMEQPMMSGALAYLISGDMEIGRYAVSVLTALAKWDVNGASSYKTQDQVHRLIAYESAIAYDWLYDIMTEQERKLVLDMIRTRTKTMVDDLLYSKQNLQVSPYLSHGWTAFGYIGIIAVATYNEIPEAKEWLRAILPMYTNLLPPWSGEDGGWSQGTGYYQASTIFFKEFADVLEKAGIINLYEKAWTKNEMKFITYAHPAGSVGAFGDGSYEAPNVGDAYNLSRLSSMYKDPIIKWVQEEVKDLSYFFRPSVTLLGNYWLSYLNVVDGYPDLKSEAPISMPLACSFKDIGWACMHSDLIDQNRVSMFFKSSPYGSYNHSHADQNSFIIQAYGEPLAIDSGYYRYGDPYELNYTRQTFAHNGITLDGGKGQTVWSFKAKGMLKEFIHHNDFDVVTGDATQAYDGELKKAVRNIVYIRPDTFIVIDDLETNKSEGSSFEWWLNGMNDISLYESGTGGRVVQGVAVLDAKVQYPEKVKGKYSNIFSGPDLREVPLPKNFAGIPYQKRIWFETEKCPKTKIVATLDVHRKSEEARNIKSKNYENYVDLQFEDGTRAYVKTTDAEEIIAGNIKFRGAAVVKNDDSIVLVSGTFLEVDGKTIINAKTDMTVAIGKDEICTSTAEDNNISIYFPNSKSIKDNKGREINKNIGVELTQDKDYFNFTLDKGDYTFYTNGKTSESTKTENTLVATIDDKVSNIKLDGYRYSNGTIKSNGNLNNKKGLYKILSKSKGLNIKNAEVGETVALDENEKIYCEGEEQYITIKEIRVIDYAVDMIVDHEAFKKQCNIFKEAEDYDTISGKGKKYAKRSFMSGGAGVTEVNGVKDSVSYTVDIPEGGTYDLAIKYVAWFPDTSRKFTIDDNAGTFACPLTDSYGAVPEDWRAMRVKIKMPLEAGKHKLTLTGINNMWNIDWIGFIKN